jgi:hypothetical protein
LIRTYDKTLQRSYSLRHDTFGGIPLKDIPEEKIRVYHENYVKEILVENDCLVDDKTVIEFKMYSNVVGFYFDDVLIDVRAKREE